MLAAQTSPAQLAYDGEADGLMLELVNRYMAADAPDGMGPRDFVNAFYDLVDLVSPQTKAEMSRLLCRSPRTPRPVAHYLSLEPVDIGGDMLLYSPVLGKLDLLRISHAGEDEHRALIARRAGGSPATTQPADASADKSSAALLAAAARGGRLSDVETQATLAAPENADMRANCPDVGSEPAGSRAGQAGRAEAQVAPSVPAENETALAEPEHDPAERMDMHAFRRSINKAARTGDTQQVCDLLDARFGLGAEIVGRVMGDDRGDAFAVLLKADDTPAADVHRMQILLFETVGSDTEAAVRAMRIYQALSVEECEQSVQSWLHSRGSAQDAVSDRQKPAAPAARRTSHAEAITDRHGTGHTVDRPAQNAIEHRRYAF